MTESDERGVGKFDLNANVMCPERRWAAQWKYNAIKLLPEVFGDDFHVSLYAMQRGRCLILTVSMKSGYYYTYVFP